MLSNMCVFVCR